MTITSVKNETVKQLRRLRDRKARRETGLHLIEGERLVLDALKAGVVPDTIIIEEGKTHLEEAVSSFALPFINVSCNVLSACCDTETPQGILASVHTPDQSVPETYPDGLIVVLDAVQNSGNVGTVIRTADAMGASCIILGEGCADAFSPKALRAAMGSCYHIPIYAGTLVPELEKLKAQNFSLICGHLGGKEEFPEINRNCAVVIGNEGNGASEEVSSRCELVKLKMYGKAESLNASVAAGIFIYKIAEKLHSGD